ncbi:pyridoxamine 5'-phosphate oxidase [candidate division KSB1 bacterium]|nr:pyridoxamine 5'-phosphate oxidase [candidate division KSB1 bacterium]
MNLSFIELRKEYQQQTLHETEVEASPIAQFKKWFDQAMAAEVTYPDAMTLATATQDGKPSARVVLLKGVDENGFTFFTNYESHKGRELAQNPHASLVFWWKELERQVRIAGRVERVTVHESDNYFRMRPRGSQIGAWASAQSEALPTREALEQSVRAFEEKYADGEVPRPPHWGGFRVLPHTIEFWQGRLNRLHDRIRYRVRESGGWVIERLAP